MATFKICILRRAKSGVSPVYIRVTHNRKVAHIKTGKMVADSMLTKAGEVKDPYVVKALSARILRYVETLNRRETEHWSVQDVVKCLEEADKDVCFSEYAREYIDRLVDKGQERSARNYKMALQSLEMYAGSTRVMFAQLTSQFVALWIKSLERTARAKEMYPVCMRQVFKEAVLEHNDYDNDIIRIRTNPWAKVEIPRSDRPEKLAITAEECRRFFEAPMPESKMAKPLADLGRDVAMMVLCLAGINTVDLYGLQKKDCYGGVIRYKRAKTTRSRADGAYMEMRVPDILKPVMDKYATDGDDPYLLNFHRRYATTDSFGANANAGIKDVCVQALGMDRKDAYCCYTFRHTFATIARNDCKAGLDEVAFALNHSQGRSVTRGYIRICFEPAWQLNERVVGFIFGSDEASADPGEGDAELFRLSVRHMVHGALTYKGKTLAEVRDIGFNNVGQVMQKLAAAIPDHIPDRAMLAFRIENLDKGQAVTYERMAETVRR